MNRPLGPATDIPSPSPTQLSLADIPFEETRPAEVPAPRLGALFGKQTEERARARRYWLRENIEGNLNIAVHKLFGVLPNSATTKIGGILGKLAHRRYRERIFARRLAHNMAALASGSPACTEDGGRAVGSWWRNIGSTTAEFAVVNRLWREGCIRIEGEEHLETARAQAEALGGPLIFASVHLSTWEAIFAVAHEALAHPNIGPYQPEPSRFTNKIVYNLRKQRNQYLFPPGQKSAYRLRRLLSAGQASLTIFIDEVRDRQVHLPLFGRPPPSKGNVIIAVKLANASNGIILPVYLMREQGTRFRLVFLEALKPERVGGIAYPIQETVLRLNEVFEPLVLANLQHWYMLSELRLPGVDYCAD